jgi:hypothetical protein
LVSITGEWIANVARFVEKRERGRTIGQKIAKDAPAVKKRKLRLIIGMGVNAKPVVRFRMTGAAIAVRLVGNVA